MVLDKILYRIITGRLKYKKGDLFLYIEDPDPHKIQESYDIYEEVYFECLNKGIWTDEEANMLLVTKNLWTPVDDKRVEEISKKIEDLKVQAYENHHKKKDLHYIKASIRQLENHISEISIKKAQLKTNTCEGIAEEERRSWLIVNSTYLDGEIYDFEEISESQVINFYVSNNISLEKIREIARKDPWRSMWTAAKTNSELFNKPTTSFSESQLALCSFSNMYENVYQSMECPPQSVINDDDCLDGWFVVQRRKAEQHKKEKDRQQIFKNKRIANADEVYVVTNSLEDAENINDMNSQTAKIIKNERIRKIDEAGRVKQTDFKDVQNDFAMRKNQAVVQQLRGRK